MNEESRNILLNHIRDGRYMACMDFDVRLMMAQEGMELYAKPCCERIAREGLVDGVHIMRADQPPWNLGVDCQGVEQCRGILGRYLQPEAVEAFSKKIRQCHKAVTLCNNHIYKIRKMTGKELRAAKKELADEKSGDKPAVYLEAALGAELGRRKLSGRIRNLPGRLRFMLRLMGMFRGPVRTLVPFAVLAWKEWVSNGSVWHEEPRGKYAEALRRFTDSHGGTSKVGRLHGDALAKYVFLAVQAYGKENLAEVNHTKPVKSCLEIEQRYRDLKQVMEAVGRLTPTVLMKIYPVTKEYDGDRWNRKDYFFTMDKLRKLPADKPIGDAQDVACLLWDYQNEALMFLLLQWMNVLGDLEVYCDEPGPNEEFHERLTRRSKSKKEESEEKNG